MVCIVIHKNGINYVIRGEKYCNGEISDKKTEKSKHMRFVCANCCVTAEKSCSAV